MLLKELKLKNWCQHDNVHVKFDKAINGILGSNGSGKSNLIAACKFALTGTIDKKNSVKGDEIRYGTNQAIIELIFEINNIDIVVYREITKDGDKVSETGTKLTLPGGKTIEGIKDVNKYILNTLKINNHIIKNTIFVNQGDIDKLLFQGPSERKLEFQKLLGTDNTESIRDVLKIELDNLDSIIDIINLINNKNETLKSYNTNLNNYKLELQQYINTYQTLEKELAEALHCVELAGQCDKASKRLVEVNQTYTKLTDELNAVDQELIKLNTNISKLEIDKASLVDAISEFRLIEANYSSQLKDWNQKVLLQTKLKELVCPQPVACPNPAIVKAAQVEGYSSTVDFIKNKIKELEEVNKHIQLIDKGICVTCGNTIKPETINKLTSTKTTLENILGNSEITKKQAVEYESNLKIYRAAKVKYEELTNSYNEQLKLLQHITEPSKNQLDLKELHAALQIVEKQLATLKLKLEQFNNNKLELTINRKNCDTEKLVLIKTIAAAPSQFNVQQANLVINKAGELQRSIAISNAKVDIETLNINNLTKEIAELGKDIPEVVKLNEYIRVLSDSRGILHKDKLPALVTASFLSKLNVKISEFLLKFNTAFSVKIEPDTSINCLFPSGMIINSDRLSGGQKICLALACRFAINNIFCNNMGLLVLDEPTAYLDDDNVKNVADIINYIKDYSQSTGIQLIMITHDKYLESYFDKVIKL